MIGYADHLMANVAHQSEAPKMHPSVVPNVRIASAVHLMANAVHPSEAPEVHPSVVSNVR